MPRTINHIELLGRVGVEPELRYTGNGTAVTRLRLATDRPTRNGDSETDWHTVICWAKLGEAVNSYVNKGDRVYVSGRITYRSYEDREGQKRQQTEVHAQDVVFLDSSPGAADSGDDEERQGDDLPF